ncbi:hypothetical protein BD847_0124 [Flavobacterium cutihirudinis]|uniref:Uncharacterized protein n=1 Tax=Flavobacterium cutihirudinis TaxID=1265740 RepID=A0A3D9FZ84_9FLAO|nr:hypothetical protein [Flavobacterium cutihirudinis]RED26209.1 hypothetical protein BD847_0124 [Flavobacterium cutihirudinis]
MNYKNYSNEDLEEAYTTMMDYSGKASKEILVEIDNRGGIDIFLSTLEFNKLNKKEINRITAEVYSMSNDYSDLDFIKQFIKSDVLNHDELNELIELKFNEHLAILTDRTINQKTIYGSLAGMAVGIILSLIFYILILSLFGKIVYFPIIGVYFICYQTIKLITKQTRDNTFVFLASLAGTIITLLCLFFLYR